MKQLEAIEIICKTIIEDKLVDAIILKGSIAKNTHDEYSNIDLYLIVERDKMDLVLDKRFEYLESYANILHHFFVFFSCPQMVCVFEDGVRVNLFTTTISNLNNYDSILIIYDPKNLLENYQKRDFSLSPKEAAEYFNTFNYSLLDFEVAYARKDIAWMFRLANHLFSDLSVILRLVSHPESAKLGIKGLIHVLDSDLKEEYIKIMKKMRSENLLECVIYMVILIDNLVMRMPLEIGQYINYDFHVFVKKKILSL